MIKKTGHTTQYHSHLRWYDVGAREQRAQMDGFLLYAFSLKLSSVFCLLFPLQQVGGQGDRTGGEQRRKIKGKSSAWKILGDRATE